MYKLILADGTELDGYVLNGNNLVKSEKTDESVFENNLSTLTITNGEHTIEMKNVEFIQQVEYKGEWYMCFRELTKRELKDIEVDENIGLNLEYSIDLDFRLSMVELGLV